MITRRGFVARVCTGIVGAAVATKIPMEWVPSPIQNNAAREYLRRIYNEAISVQGLGLNLYGIVVSQWLYEQVEAETTTLERFTKSAHRDFPHLMFKGYPLIWDKQHTLPLKSALFVNQDQFMRQAMFHMMPPGAQLSPNQNPFLS